MIHNRNPPSAGLRPPGAQCRTLGLTAVVLLLCLSGCGRILGQFESENALLVSAEPLCEETPGNQLTADGSCKSAATFAQAQGQGQQPTLVDAKEYLGLVLKESQYKCGRFLNGLTLASTGTRFGLDSLTTIASALGAVFTPLATVHALAASSAITSGIRGAVDSDIYAKAAISAYSQAIQASYSQRFQSYIDGIDTMDESGVVRSIEFTKIQSFHKLCALAPAQATIAATLRASGAGDEAAAALTVAVTADPKAGVTYKLTGSIKGLEVSYTAASGDTRDTVAEGLVKKIKDNTAFQDAGVSAGPASKGSFTLKSPKGITWTPSDNLTIGGGKPAASAGATNTSALTGMGPGAFKTSVSRSVTAGGANGTRASIWGGQLR